MGIVRLHEKDHLLMIRLLEVETNNHGKCLTFTMDGGYEMIPFEQLEDIHKKIGKMLLEGKEEYDPFKEWFDKQ